LYELPYQYSWFEHECGVPQVGVMDGNAPGELRRRSRVSTALRDSRSRRAMFFK
jgi:hypothetical protein